MSDVADLQKRALTIAKRYDELHNSAGRSVWRAPEFAMGFVGDVGDLLKLVMAKENLRHIDEVDAKLEHELADCLWSLLVLADRYGIDLEKAFLRTMDELQERLSGDMA